MSTYIQHKLETTSAAGLHYSRHRRRTGRRAPGAWRTPFYFPPSRCCSGPTSMDPLPPPPARVSTLSPAGFRGAGGERALLQALHMVHKGGSPPPVSHSIPNHGRLIAPSHNREPQAVHTMIFASRPTCTTARNSRPTQVPAVSRRRAPSGCAAVLAQPCAFLVTLWRRAQGRLAHGGTPTGGGPACRTLAVKQSPSCTILSVAYHSAFAPANLQSYSTRRNSPSPR